MHTLKTKSRVGSIFFDKVKRVLAVIERPQNDQEDGVIQVVKPSKRSLDYLVEWEFCKKDRLKPTTSIVKGAHFVFVKPLMYRRFVEEHLN